MILNLDLLPHQAAFVEDITTPSLGLIGGYGSGKTYSMAVKLLTLACHNAGYEGIALSPTYGMATKVLVPAIEQLLRDQGVKYHFNKSALTFELEILKRKTILHVMAAETYKRVAGINAAFFGVDELDLIDPETARAAWQMLTSRLRRGKVFQGCATTTPEGFRFAYDFFVDEVKQKAELAAHRRIIKAKTTDNPYLPASYIANLYATYPPHLLQAYLEGEFVNLNGLVVYQNFDKTENHTTLSLKDVLSTETLHIGMDFNVEGMSAVTSVVRGSEVHVIDELIGAKNTQALCDDIRKRYTEHRFVIHPDPACVQRKTSTVDTDLAILRQNGFAVRPMASHPAIKDRVNSVNAMFLNGLGDRRMRVNTVTCPLLTKSLLGQTWDANGKPKKGQKIGVGANETQVDGPLDALGYFTYATFPLRPVSTSPLRLVGV